MSESESELSQSLPLSQSPPPPPSGFEYLLPLPCGVCSVNLHETDAEGNFVHLHESNESEGIHSNCDCWFCLPCLDWMHRFHVTRCRACNGNIHDLVVFRPCSHIPHSSCESDAESDTLENGSENGQ